MIDPLLSIKLFAPPLQPGFVCRSRLLEKLDQGLRQGRQVTLISAPAGYGKTSLSRVWVETLDRPYTWLSLDRADNHPPQFLAYLTAALQAAGVQLPAQVLAAENGVWKLNGIEAPESAARALINAISAASQPFVLVLDDYHTLTDLAVQDAGWSTKSA